MDADTLADPWLGALLPGNITVVQRLSSTERLYRAVGSAGENLFARMQALQRVTTPIGWREHALRLRRLRSRYFTRFVDVIEHHEYAVFLSEYVEGERLYDRLRQSGPLGAELALTTALQLCIALEQYGNGGFKHGRLDSRAVLTHRDSNGELRITIGSFGTALALPQPIVAKGYQPPYISTTPPDMFAVGALLFEMLTGISPHKARLDDDVIEMSASVLRPPSQFIAALRRYPMIDVLVHQLTSSEAELSWDDAVHQLDDARQRVRGGNGRTLPLPNESWPAQAHTTDVVSKFSREDRPRTDVRRRATVELHGEEHNVHLRGTVIKLRPVSGGSRWGPESIRFDVKDHQIDAVLACVTAVDNLLWLGSDDGHVIVLDPHSEELRVEAVCETRSAIMSVAGRPNLVVAGSADGFVWVSVDGAKMTKVPGSGGVTHVAVADRAPRFAVGRRNGNLEIHEVEPDGNIRRIRAFTLEAITGLTLSVDGRQVAVSDLGETALRDVSSGDAIGTFGQFSELIDTTDVMRARTRKRKE